MMEEQVVRKAIQSLIKRKEQRIASLLIENRTQYRSDMRISNELNIAAMERSIDTLIELEHNLRLCDCPPEAWDKEVRL